MSKPNRFAALQHRDFRLLWFGQALSTTGSQMQVIAINWHVFQLLEDQQVNWQIWGRTVALDGQALGLGGLGLVRILPMLLAVLIGGSLADTADRRKLLLITQLGAGLLSLVLAWITFSGAATLSILYLLTAVGAVLFAVDEPAYQALVPNFVPRRDLANAISFTTMLWYLGTIVGPGIAGWLIATFDVGLVYGLNALSFGGVLVALIMLRFRDSDRKGAKVEIAAIGQGVRYTYNNKLIWSSMLIDFWATFFGSARTMLPIVADRILNMGVQGYGWLATAQPVGAVLAALYLAWRGGQIKRSGLVLLVSVAVYGLATAFFGLATGFVVAYLLFALTGTADTISTVIRGTIRQLSTPDHLRGRVTSVHTIFAMGGPQLGEVEAGLVAAIFSAPVAIVSGGLATVVVTAYLAWRYASLRNYDLIHEEDGL